MYHIEITENGKVIASHDFDTKEQLDDFVRLAKIRMEWPPSTTGSKT